MTLPFREGHVLYRVGTPGPGACRIVERMADDLAHPAEADVRTLFDHAQASHPTVRASYQLFKGRVVSLAAAGDEPSPERALDLYLACACEEGDAAALRHFESSLMPGIRAAIAGLVGQEDLIDEVAQELRRRLFCPPTPRIAAYSGRGPLWKWLRITATRTAYDVHRSRGVAPAGIDDLTDLFLQDQVDPEFQVVRQRYGDVVRAGLCEALALLSTDEKTLLRLRYLQNQGIDSLAVPFKAHRSTVARKLRAIREKLLTHLRQSLGVHIPRLSDSEARSLWRAVRSQVHFSFSRLVGPGADPPPSRPSTAP